MFSPSFPANRADADECVQLPSCADVAPSFLGIFTLCTIFTGNGVSGNVFFEKIQEFGAASERTLYVYFTTVATEGIVER